MSATVQLRVVLPHDTYGLRERLRAHAEFELVDDLGDADAVVSDQMSGEQLRAAPRLRLVQALSAGADRIDRSALPPGCALCNVYAHEDAIGEWVLMAMLALTHHLLPYDRALRSGDWLRGLPLERELRGRTVGAIGLGHIGKRVVELARAFGMEAIAVTRSPSPERAAGLRWLGALDSLDRLLAEADFAVVSVPLTSDTEGLVGRPELDLLGGEGYLVNVARGAVVDERALYEALRDRRIAGAALDVWWQYPKRRGEVTQPSEFPFGELDNVVMTPHVSGRSVGTERGRTQFVVDQLVRLARGLPLENVLAVGPPS